VTTMRFLSLSMKARQGLERIRRLEYELGSARVKGLDYCIRCGWCCTSGTCRPTPDELEDIALFLGLSVHDAIQKYFAIDKRSWDNIYYLKPVGVNTKHLSGKFIPADETFNEGRCIFLDQDNLCTIYDVRPKAARLAKCWEQDDGTWDPVEFWKDNVLKTRFGIDGQALEVTSHQSPVP
jgi:Fe-S-cluster containining protein